MTDMQKSRTRTNVLIQINLEADNFYEKSQELGLLAAEAFLEQKGGNKRNEHRAQMTGLENVAETTRKVSDVLDYIKKQTARQEAWNKPSEAGWLSENVKEPHVYENKCFGEILKNCIENDLNEARARVCSTAGIGEITDEDKRARQQVYLDLIRQMVRQLVVHYEYKIRQPGKNQLEEKGGEKR